MRVLLVDDDREVADYVRRELEDESFDVTVAHDGASALHLAETSAFDMIVLDVMMPFMDGLQVTRRLRTQNISTPILLLTGLDAPEEIVNGLDAGADDYLAKPFSFDVCWHVFALVRVNLTGRMCSCALQTCCST